MKYQILLISIVIICSCRQQKVHPEPIKSQIQSDFSYRALLDSLKNNGGYFDFELIVKLDRGEIKGHEKDSLQQIIRVKKLAYEKACSHFFAQDMQFVRWLLQYRHDTTYSDFWHEYLSPLSSTIGACSFRLSNASAAASLLISFLNGKDISCNACGENVVACTEKQYQQIQDFLSANKGRTVKELREAWALEVHRK